MSKELSSHDPLQSFIHLITFDQELAAIKRDIAVLEQAIEELNRNEQELVLKKDTVYKAVQEAKRAVDTYELEMQHLDDQEKLKKKQLDIVSNVKQYQSLTAEVDILKKEQHILEEDLIRAWNSLESANKVYQEYNQFYEKECKNIAIALQEKKEERAQRMKQRELAEEERAHKGEGIPEEWLERYEAMKDKITNPVVPIDQEYCSACHYTISAQDIQRLHKRALLSCKNCFRFLYDPMVQATSSE